MKVPKSVFFTSVLILFACNLNAQVYVKGRVLDKQLLKPINSVNVIHKTSSSVSSTNNKGEFSIRLESKNSTLHFSHISFRDTSLSLKNLPWTKDTLFIEVLLDYDLVKIPTAEIESDPLPEIVFSDEKLHVGDFLFFNDGLLLLTYGKEDRWKRQEYSKITPFSTCEIIIQDSSRNRLKNKLLQGEFIRLEKAYNGDIILHSLDKIFLLNTNNLDITLRELDKAHYSKAYVPILDSLSNFVLLTDYSPDFPSFSYYAYNPADSAYQEIRKIQDNLQMQLLRSEFKYLPTRGKLDAYRMELKTGIDKEIIAAWMSGFSESMYAEPLYSPCIVVGDTLCIFNHYNDQLFRHVNPSSTLDSTGISHHKLKTNGKWKKHLLHDEISGKIYVQYDKNGYTYLSALNLQDGTLGKSFRLTYRYPEKIQVRNNEAYYLYRPFGSVQKHYLYKEELEF